MRMSANVLCETVIMHLSTPEIPATTRLLSLLDPGSTLYHSWQTTAGPARP